MCRFLDVSTHTNEDDTITITPNTIASLWSGEPLDLDWTMTAIFCAHPPTPQPRAETPTEETESVERSAERNHNR